MSIDPSLGALVLTEVDILLLGLVVWFVPNLDRPDSLFFVRLPPEFREGQEAREIVRRYRVHIAVLTLVVLVFGAIVAMYAGLWGLAVTLPALAGFIAVCGSARKQVLPHLSEPLNVRRVPLRRHRERLPLGTVGLCLPSVGLALAAIHLWQAWKSLPEEIPLGSNVRWQVHGATVHWMPKSPLLLGSQFCFFFGMSVFMAVSAYGLVHWARPIYQEGELGRLATRLLRMILWMILIVDYLVSGLGAFMLLMPTLAPATGDKDLFFEGAVGIVMAGVLAWLVVYLRTKSQLRTAEQALTKDGRALPSGPEANEANWRGGYTFYFNREDPAIWVQDPSFMRYTLNFARPASWVLTAILGVSVAALAVFICLCAL